MAASAHLLTLALTVFLLFAPIHAKACEQWSKELAHLIFEVKQVRKLRSSEDFEVFITKGFFAWNVTKAIRLIRQRKIRFKAIEMPLEDYAMEFLGLDADLGWDVINESTLRQVSIDREFAQNLTSEEVSVPGVAVEFDSGLSFDGSPLMLIDGHHRLAQLYMSGKRTMPVVVISAQELSKIDYRLETTGKPSEPVLQGNY